MRKKIRYASLKDIRDEKEHARQQIDYGVDRLKNDVADYFVYHPEHFFLDSSNKYMNYVGYAISAYKTATAFRSLFSFFSKKRK
ncbi:MAG: hypothetical protein J6T11_03265 [Bacteroidaceae bacterium]|nr:hypothetical protein [Bacteroidaceae bacterium]